MEVKDGMIEQFEINKENIDLFETPEWNRILRYTNVDKLKSKIKNSKFHLTILTINKRNGKYRVINGNHRLQAIKDSLENPVKIILDVHENLNDDEERELFTDINVETSQTADDFLYIYKSVIPYFKQMNNMEVKISVYPHESAIRLKTILDAIYSAKSETKEFNVKGISRDKALKIAKELTEKDIKALDKFLKLYCAGVGKKVQDNLLYRPIILIPVLNVFLRHEFNGLLKTRERMTNAQWQKIFRKMKTDFVLLNYAEMNTSREKMRDIRERILKLAVIYQKLV